MWAKLKQTATASRTWDLLGLGSIPSIFRRVHRWRLRTEQIWKGRILTVIETACCLAWPWWSSSWTAPPRIDRNLAIFWRMASDPFFKAPTWIRKRLCLQHYEWCLKQLAQLRDLGNRWLHYPLLRLHNWLHDRRNFEELRSKQP
jgi:hypothetical protein